MMKFFSFLLFLFFTATAAAAGVLYWFVVLHPGTEIEASNIEAILGQESPVFYSDNVTKLGVFFDEAHRQYVRYDEIPGNFVNALVAAEDNRFFDHIGFDPVGIGRATMKNIQAGRIVQGGSTLTQQTAKNLFKRTERSFKAKLKELLFALRLEYHYPKEKIFEFYANQFYVSGNGHGLGVAARYYFDKKASELNLIECAFIAGSVKRPNFYNPFIQKTEAATVLARLRGQERLTYVLDKMLELGMIDSNTKTAALASDLEFKQGQVGYSLDYVMDLVKDAVSSNEVLAELERHGIDNVSTSGIRIVTTVDKKIQESALYALRHDLSRLDVLLRGYEREEVQKEYSALEYNGDENLVPGAFLFGLVESVSGAGDTIAVTVDFGHKTGRGVITAEGIKRLAESRAKWKKEIWTKAGAKDVQNLANQIVAGDKIWVSVRELGEQGNALLDLEKYPKVQGGAIVLKDGAIRAMVGGAENRFYNRAVLAKRTMGSSFKPFVYAAALQLGWNSSDLLKNTRDIFVYQNQPYYPHPDHVSPFSNVSLSWAGVKSENLATIWLLAHLCDNLNPIQFRDLAEHLDLTPRVVDGQTESYRAYRTRIRDTYGIMINTETLNESAYKAAVRNSEADFMFENMVAEYSYFKSINYGLNYDRYRKQLEKEVASGESGERNELQLRRGVLGMNYLTLRDLRARLNDYAERLDSPGAVFESDFTTDERSSHQLFKDLQTGQYVFQPSRIYRPNLVPVSRQGLQDELFGLSSQERGRFWEKVSLYGEVSVAAFDLLARQVEAEYQRLERELPYSFEVLADVNDFRIFVGLRYLIALAREMGVKSDLQPVLSFPLGSNVVSLLEMTRLYEGLVTGSVTTYGTEPLADESDSLLVIDRIESADGTVLYKPEQHAKTVLGPKERTSIGHVLENVIKFGTGRQADKEVVLASDSTGSTSARNVKVPLFGKTGTANDYTNASFFGYLPGVAADGDGLTTKNGYAVGTYVGFDDNTPMKKSSIRISGSAGALPTWIEIVNTLIREDGYAAKIDPVELSFNGLVVKREQIGQVNLAVDPENGGVVVNPVRIVGDSNREQPSILTFGTLSADNRYVPIRNYEPFWRVGNAPQ